MWTMQGESDTTEQIRFTGWPLPTADMQRVFPAYAGHTVKDPSH